MKKSLKKTILLMLLMLIILTTCLVGFTQEKVIKFARPEDLLGLDPCDRNKGLNFILNFMVYDRLVDLDYSTDSTGFVPALATEWKLSPDGKEYTFKLREGIKYHNGESFNAECVKITLERFLTEKTLGLGELVVGLKEVEIIDDYTVIVKFDEPNAMFLYNLTLLPMIPAEAFKEKGTALFDNPVGTGAFTWGHWKHAQEIVLYKNPNYWGEPAHMDKFVYFPIMEISTRLAGVLTGEVDIVVDMSTDQIPTVESSDNVETVRFLAWDQIYIAPKIDKPPFTDKKFRQALSLSIDREDITKYILKGGSRVASGILMKGINGFDESKPSLKQDLEKAKQLLKESSYNGELIDIMVPIDWFPSERAIGQALKGSWDEIGINNKLSIVEGATFANRRAGDDFDIFVNQNGIVGDIGSFLVRVAYSNNYHIGDMSNINPELKNLALKQLSIVDGKERIEMLRKIDDMIIDECAPIIPICQYEGICFQQKGIQGVRYFGTRWPDLRYAHYEEW